MEGRKKIDSGGPDRFKKIQGRTQAGHFLRGEEECRSEEIYGGGDTSCTNAGNSLTGGWGETRMSTLGGGENFCQPLRTVARSLI